MEGKKSKQAESVEGPEVSEDFSDDVDVDVDGDGDGGDDVDDDVGDDDDDLQRRSFQIPFRSL